MTNKNNESTLDEYVTYDVPKTYYYKMCNNLRETISISDLGIDYNEIRIFIAKNLSSDYFDGEKIEFYGTPTSFDPFETGEPQCCELLDALNHKDFLIMDDLMDITNSWGEIDYFLEGLSDKEISLRIGETFIKDINKLIKSMQVGLEFALPYNNETVNKLLELYKHYVEIKEYEPPKFKTIDISMIENEQTN